MLERLAMTHYFTSSNGAVFFASSGDSGAYTGSATQQGVGLLAHQMLLLLEEPHLTLTLKGQLFLRLLGAEAAAE